MHAPLQDLAQLQLQADAVEFTEIDLLKLLFSIGCAEDGSGF